MGMRRIELPGNCKKLIKTETEAATRNMQNLLRVDAALPQTKPVQDA
ncbi:hypothetical protein LT85_4377 [Collimonas arenae]|uniref:Uncharacterized protein n=1 Tax=Collimonas arenae TaxID=279058 RepID=A0A0A1FIK2_9BURK|nr:hypothetical protein LT85_4377 [Collimonas arenae]